MQTILIFVLFAVALGYLGWRAYTRFVAKEAGCGKGCGCATDARSPAARRAG
ncbi:FeoB-associated Cys-rich membrane protein [Fibrella arboris]|uniref:FeoB-associated Cys-rich membrane protein n=1 Tax=Fibrella arboris TaxID=3242486 RepID=UPI003520A606